MEEEHTEPPERSGGSPDSAPSTVDKENSGLNDPQKEKCEQQAVPMDVQGGGEAEAPSPNSQDDKADETANQASSTTPPARKPRRIRFVTTEKHPLVPKKNEQWIGEVIKCQKTKANNRGRPADFWVLIWCRAAGRMFLYHGKPLDFTVRSGLTVEFFSPTTTLKLGDKHYQEATKVAPATMEMAKIPEETHTHEAWVEGTYYANKGKCSIKRNLSPWGGPNADITFDKDHMCLPRNAYIKNGTPVLYTTYIASDGKIGAVVNGHDLGAQRRKVTSQICPSFLQELQPNWPTAYVLGGLNCPHYEQELPNQTTLEEILRISPDFSKVRLAVFIDAMRKANDVAEDTPTPDIIVLSEGRTPEEWHTAINTHLDTSPHTHGRDRHSKITLLSQVSQLTTRANVHATLCLDYMHLEHRANNHASQLTIVEGGISLGTRADDGEFITSTSAGKLCAMTYHSAPPTLDGEASLVGTLHRTATSTFKSRFVQPSTRPFAPPVRRVVFPPDSTIPRSSQGLIVSYPRSERKKVQEAVQHICGASVTLTKLSYHISDPKVEGAIFTGNAPWGVVANSLNAKQSDHICAMSMVDFLHKNGWTLSMGEGVRINLTLMRDLLKSGTFMRCGARSYRVAPQLQEVALKKMIEVFNDLQKTRQTASNPKHKGDVSFLHMSRGDTIHWFGAPKRKQHGPWVGTPLANRVGLQGYVLLGAHPTTPVELILRAMQDLGVTAPEAKEACWFSTARQEHGVQLYAGPDLASPESEPVDIDGAMYSLMPLHKWGQDRRLGAKVATTQDFTNVAQAAAIAERVEGATARLPKPTKKSATLLQELQLAYQARAIGKKFLLAKTKRASATTARLSKEKAAADSANSDSRSLSKSLGKQKRTSAPRKAVAPASPPNIDLLSSEASYEALLESIQGHAEDNDVIRIQDSSDEDGPQDRGRRPDKEERGKTKRRTKERKEWYNKSQLECKSSPEGSENESDDMDLSEDDNRKKRTSGKDPADSQGSVEAKGAKRGRPKGGKNTTTLAKKTKQMEGQRSIVTLFRSQQTNSSSSSSSGIPESVKALAAYEAKAMGGQQPVTLASVFPNGFTQASSSSNSGHSAENSEAEDDTEVQEEPSLEERRTNEGTLGSVAAPAAAQQENTPPSQLSPQHSTIRSRSPSPAATGGGGRSRSRSPDSEGSGQRRRSQPPAGGDTTPPCEEVGRVEEL